MLITLEGIDGMGKTTIMKRLNKRHLILTKEPGSPHIPINKQLRKMVLTNKALSAFERELLFYVDASQHSGMIDAIETWGLETVVSDRGYWSHLAYLYATLKTKQMDWEQYSICKKLIDMCCKKPDAVIYFQGTVELMKSRLDSKEKDVIEASGDQLFTWVLTAYDDLLKSETIPVLILNGADTIDKNLVLCEDFINHVSRELSKNTEGSLG